MLVFNKKSRKSCFYRDKKVDLFIIGEYFSVMFERLTLRFFSFAMLMLMITVPSEYLFSQGKGIVLEEIEIQGKIQKPEAMYFLSRSKFAYRTLDLDVSFVEKVEKALHVENAF